MRFIRRRIDTVGQVGAELQVDASDNEVEKNRKAFNQAAAEIRVNSETEGPIDFFFLGMSVFIYRGHGRALMVRIQAPDGDRSKLIWLNGLVVVLCRDPESQEKPATISSYMKEDIEPETRETWGPNFFGRIPVVGDSWGDLGIELRVPDYHW